MKNPEEIFEANYGHVFDITPAFEGAFKQCSSDVAKYYAIEVLIDLESHLRRCRQETFHLTELIDMIDVLSREVRS